MSEKTPRLRPHERPRGVNPHIKEYGGKLSLTDGVFIPRVAPPVEGDVGPLDTAEVMEIIDNAPPDDYPPIAA